MIKGRPLLYPGARYRTAPVVAELSSLDAMGLGEWNGVKDMQIADRLVALLPHFSRSTKKGVILSGGIFLISLGSPPAKRAVMPFGWVFFLIPLGSPHVLRAHRGRTCGERQTKSY